MPEDMKWIPGYEGKYKITTDGTVISYWRNAPRILKQYVNDDGYLEVGLYNGKGVDTRRVHRLLALTYIPNPDNLPVIDHIDANKLNNDLSNLRWSSIYDNVHNSITSERRSESIIEYCKSPEVRDKRSKTMSAYCATAEGKAQRSENGKRIWQDPVLRNQMSESMKAHWQTDNGKVNRSEANVRSWKTNTEQRLSSLRTAAQDPVVRKKHSDGMKKAWPKRKAATYLPLVLDLNSILYQN